MKQTALHQKHLRASVKMTEFQGWQVPQAYTDAQDEHHAVRGNAGLFDVGFLGRIEVTGPAAVEFLQKMFTGNIAKIPEHSAHYCLLCNDKGGIIDDAIVFRLSNAGTSTRFLLSTNAMNAEKVLEWLTAHASSGTQISDVTRPLAQLSLQGPRSAGVLEKFLGTQFRKFKPRSLKELALPDLPLLVARTGYTGELGYELFIAADKAETLWDSLLNAGSEFGLLPCGLTSRDTLRLEMGYPSYGYDIDEKRTPLQAGLTAFVDFKKEFIGKEALLAEKAAGVQEKLAGFLLTEKSAPRPGGSIFSENRQIGVVTSGAFSPALRNAIGLGYVVSRYAQPGQEIEIELRDREIVANIVELPFYRKK
jgi:aminomethyltransferase